MNLIITVKEWYFLSWQCGRNFDSETIIVMKGISRKSGVLWPWINLPIEYRNNYVGYLSLWYSLLVHNLHLTVAYLLIKFLVTVCWVGLWAVPVGLCFHAPILKDLTFPFLILSCVFREWATGFANGGTFLRRKLSVVFWDWQPLLPSCFTFVFSRP